MILGEHAMPNDKIKYCLLPYDMLMLDDSIWWIQELTMGELWQIVAFN